MGIRFKVRRRAGFSLVMVLIVFLIGVSITAGIMYMMTRHAGASRVGVVSEAGYNIMQDGLEQGKSTLKSRITSLGAGDSLPRREGKSEDKKIASAEDLLIYNGTVVNNVSVPIRELGGKSGKLTVKIYDLRYTSDDIAPALHADEAKLMKMPPAMLIGGGPAVMSEDNSVGIGDIEQSGATTETESVNAGVYLIRSSLTIGGRTRYIESIVVQSKRE